MQVLTLVRPLVLPLIAYPKPRLDRARLSLPGALDCLGGTFERTPPIFPFVATWHEARHSARSRGARGCSRRRSCATFGSRGSQR